MSSHDHLFVCSFSFSGGAGKHHHHHFQDWCEAQSAGISESDIYYLTPCDMNVPGARTSERVNELASCVQFANDLSPLKHGALLELPDVPHKSAKRGLWDEEKEISEALWGLRQVCDSRWVCPFELHPSAEAHSNRRLGLIKFLLESVNCCLNFIYWTGYAFQTLITYNPLICQPICLGVSLLTHQALQQWSNDL